MMQAFYSTWGLIVKDDSPIPETPAPSSRTFDAEFRRPLVNKKFDGLDIHSANSGVTFQTTVSKELVAQVHEAEKCVRFSDDTYCIADVWR